MRYLCSKLPLIFGLVMMAVLSISPHIALAQQTTPTSPYDAYFVAPDDNDINQVWGLTLAGGVANPLTQADAPVFNYAVSPDAMHVAYTSDGQLWLQTLGAEAQSLLPLTQEAEEVKVAFRLDGQSLVYGDSGLFILSLATRTTEQLLTDSRYEVTNNPEQVQHYDPVSFLTEDRLLLQIAEWEGSTAAIYALSSRTLLQTEYSYNGLHITPLADGSYLYYTGTRVGLGIDGFLIGTPPESLSTAFELVPLLVERFESNNLAGAGIHAAVEVMPGRIRFMGTGLSVETSQFEVFLGEYDFTTDTFTIDRSDRTINIIHTTVGLSNFSPDGRYLVGYELSDDPQNPRGKLAIVDLETMMRIEVHVPDSVESFQWAQK